MSQFVRSLVVAAVLSACAGNPPAPAPAPIPTPPPVAAPLPPLPPQPVKPSVTPLESSLPRSSEAAIQPGLPTPIAAFPPMRSGSTAQWIMWDKQRRSYWLHVPRGYDGKTALPLVMVLHARASSAQAAHLLGFNQKADAAGFIAVYPEALGAPRIWNAGHDRGPSNADDLGYIQALVTTVRTSLNVDPRRLYLVGHSSGGMMAYRVAAESSLGFAAVGAIGAAVGSRDRAGAVKLIAPRMPVSVMHIHGRLDRTVPYAGGRSATIVGADYLGVRDATSLWTKTNGCAQAPRTSQVGNISRDVYADCSSGSHVEIVSITNGGADWPGLLRIDPRQRQNAIDVLWDFFSVHQRG